MLRTGLCGCGAVLGFGHGLWKAEGTAIKTHRLQETQGWIADLEQKMIKGAETPGWRKAEKGEMWIKSLMNHMDIHFDTKTKVSLMQACGRSCYINAFGIAPEEKPSTEEAKRYIGALKARGYEVRQDSEKTTILFSWGRDHQNPQGLILSDGYCMCPLVETGPAGLSPTFCYCSTGYVKEMFERALGQFVQVELLDSLKMGGKDCIFEIATRPIW
jgi:hypothetical protein